MQYQIEYFKNPKKSPLKKDFDFQAYILLLRAQSGGGGINLGRVYSTKTILLNYVCSRPVLGSSVRNLGHVVNSIKVVKCVNTGNQR